MLTLPSLSETPPGGWKYTSENGVPFPDKQEGFIYAWDVLVDRVKKHRMATGGDLEVGWLERFIDELCRQNPEYPCMQEAPYSERKIGLPEIKRFLHTAQKFIANGGKAVDAETANARAAICARCPKNVEIIGCWGCTGLLTLIMELFPNHQTEYDLSLKSCQVCSCTLRAKVWLPEEVMAEDGIDKSEFPEWCWLSPEFKQ